LGDYGEEAKSALPMVVAALQDANPSSRNIAIRTLARLDPESKLLPGALADWFGQQNRKEEAGFRRDEGFKRLLEQLPTDTLAGLNRLLSDPEETRRVGAALALASGGRGATGSTAALRD